MAHGTSQYTGPDADWLLFNEYDDLKMIDRLKFIRQSFRYTYTPQSSEMTVTYRKETQWYTIGLKFDENGLPITPHNEASQHFAHWLFRQPA